MAKSFLSPYHWWSGKTERGKTRIPVLIRGMSVRINFLLLVLPFRVHRDLLVFPGTLSSVD